MIEGNVTTPSAMTSIVSGLQAQDVADLASYIGSLGSDSISGMIVHNGITYGTITSAETGRVWLDRNLGASQVCTSLDDEACYGDYYQWGREADGHEKSDSARVSTQASTITPADANFVIGSSDWTTDSDGALRSAAWSKTDGTSVCPVSYRVPTKNEWDLEEAAFENRDEALAILKLPSSGSRDFYPGLVSGQGSFGSFWSSSFYVAQSSILNFNSSYAGTFDQYRTFGHSVRCIKD